MIHSFENIRRLTGHQGSIYCSIPLSDTEFLTSGGDGMILQWQVDSEEPPVLRVKASGTILSIAYSAEDSLLFSGNLQGGLQIFDLKSKTEVKHLIINRKGIFDIKLTARHILLAGGDGTFTVLNRTNFKRVYFEKLSDKSLRKIDVFGELIGISKSDNGVHFLDVASFNTIRTFVNHRNSVFSIKFSRDGKHIITGSRDAHLNVTDINSETILHAIPAHNFAINDIAFHPVENLFATASRDKSIKLWNSIDYSFIKKLDVNSNGHINSVNSIFWINNYLFSASDDRSILQWKLSF